MKPILLIFCVFFLLSCVSNNGSTGLSVKNAKKIDKAQVHAMLAEGYLQKKKYPVVRLELAKALKINPKHSQSYYILALLNLELGDYKKANEAFNYAVKYNRKNYSAAHDYGVFLCRRGKEKKSIKYFLLAANNPYFQTPELSYMRAGDCLANIGDSSAEQYLKKALSLRANMPPALFKLALIKFQNADAFSARAYIQRYFAVAKPSAASLYLAYQIEKKLGAEQFANQYREQLLHDFSASEQAKRLRRNETE